MQKCSLSRREGEGFIQGTMNGKAITLSRTKLRAGADEPVEDSSSTSAAATAAAALAKGAAAAVRFPEDIINFSRRLTRKRRMKKKPMVEKRCIEYNHLLLPEK
ncbi:general transcription and DNA repair factor IIH helicase/translocase subunit XPB-like [Drosophila virilis]|uniref:general transcription and DNA repair factor IIH helicase/translocase subunit XPB-like n=1 Tax=Drosophila virilis TaxID=7244 RepID=UPI0038B2D974